MGTGTGTGHGLTLLENEAEIGYAVTGCVA